MYSLLEPNKGHCPGRTAHEPYEPRYNFSCPKSKSQATVLPSPLFYLLFWFSWLCGFWFCFLFAHDQCFFSPLLTAMTEMLVSWGDHLMTSIRFMGYSEPQTSENMIYWSSFSICSLHLFLSSNQVKKKISHMARGTVLWDMN